MQASEGYNINFGESLLVGGDGYVEIGLMPGDLIANWKFENNLLDETSDHNLTWIGDGTPAYLSGPTGQAVALSGSNYLSTPDSADLNFGSKMMISMSFSTSYSAQPQTLISQWDAESDNRGWLLRLNSDGKIEFLATNDGTYGGDSGSMFNAKSSIGNLNNGNFHTISILWGAGEFDIFIDGNEDTSVVFPNSNISTIHDSTAQIVVGGRPDNLQSFYGAVDEVQLYNGGRLHVAEYLSQNPGLTMGDLLGDLPSSLSFLDDTKGSISLWLYSNVDVVNKGDHVAMFSYGGNDSPGSPTAGFGMNFRRDDDFTPGQKVYFYQGNEEANMPDYWSLLNGADTMSKEEWYHLVFTSDGATWKLYLQGEEVALENNTEWLSNHGDWFGDTHFKAGGEAFSIGSRLWRVWGGVAPHRTGWNGRLDDFRIYDEELSQADVTSLYEGNNVTNSLVAYWDFNGDTEDKTGNGQHGFMRGDAELSYFDNIPPIVSNIIENASNDSMNIIWDTNELANSQIIYDPISSPWSETILNANLNLNHSVLLENLQPCTKYYYKIRSEDEIGNVALSNEKSFTVGGCTGGASVLNGVEKEITSNDGGVVSLISSGTGVSLNVPKLYKGGVSSAYFQIKKLTKNDFLNSASTPEDKFLASNHIYNFKSLESNSSIISAFDKPITVTFIYDNTDIKELSESSLRIYRYDGSSWGELSNCNIDTSLNSISCETSNFSDFGLFGEEDTSIEEVSNPFLSVVTGGIRYCSETITSFCAQPLVIQKEINQPTKTLGNQGVCLEQKIITQNLKSGSRNGLFNSYTKGVVTQAALLQEHLNRLGFSSGPADGILGPISDGAIKRMQLSLGTTADGYVGPITRSLINNSCGK